MVILPSASETVAHLIMSQIKSVVEQNLKTDGGSQVTLSVGVMEAKAHSQESRNVVKDVETMPSDPKEAVTLKGDLSDIAIQDIVQILESGRKCGKLVITSADQTEQSSSTREEL